MGRLVCKFITTRVWLEFCTTAGISYIINMKEGYRPQGRSQIIMTWVSNVSDLHTQICKLKQKRTVKIVVKPYFSLQPRSNGKKNKILVAFDGFNQRFKTCVTLFLIACVPNIYLNRILSREHLQTLLNKSFIENLSM